MRPRPVLLLNQNYAPLTVCPTTRALSLIERGKAEVVAYGRRPIATAVRPIARPTVIRLARDVTLPRRRIGFSRRGVHRRDAYTCQYCGRLTGRPTLDHVVPRHLGGGTTGANLVTACRDCNQRKGGGTPEQAGMALLRRPVAPTH